VCAGAARRDIAAEAEQEREGEEWQRWLQRARAALAASEANVPRAECWTRGGVERLCMVSFPVVQRRRQHALSAGGMSLPRAVHVHPYSKWVLCRPHLDHPRVQVRRLHREVAWASTAVHSAAAAAALCSRFAAPSVSSSTAEEEDDEVDTRTRAPPRALSLQQAAFTLLGGPPPSLCRDLTASSSRVSFTTSPGVWSLHPLLATADSPLSRRST
jgi:hypothetical protein